MLHLLTMKTSIQAEKKTANVTRDVSEALAKVGLEMPKTKRRFPCSC